MKVDYIIVGLGLAGLAFAEELIKSNYADEVQIISITVDQRSRVNFNEKIKIISIHVPMVDKKNLIEAFRWI